MNQPFLLEISITLGPCHAASCPPAVGALPSVTLQPAGGTGEKGCSTFSKWQGYTFYINMKSMSYCFWSSI